MPTANQATNGPSVLDLSDEELAKYATPEAFFAAHPELAAAPGGQGNSQPDPDEDDADAGKNPGEADGGGSAEDEAAAAAKAAEGEGTAKELNEEGEEDEGENQGQQNPGAAEGKPAQEQKPKTDTPPANKEQVPGSNKEGEAKGQTDIPDAEMVAAYKTLLAPFKAAGREMQVQSPEEIIRLMQMGAGYAHKMQALKPNLAKMKLLEQHGLLDETQLGFVIDLVVKKDPNAINKLLKDNGLDPMNLDPDKAGDYKPTRQSGDQRAVELDEVLDQIEHEPHFQKLITTVTRQWDQPSKDLIGQDPNWLHVLNGHMKVGIFDLVSTEVNRQRSLGQLPSSVSDLAAYKQIGDAMNAAGKFAHLVPAQNQRQQTPPERRIVDPTKSSQGAEDKRNDKRRAASASKPAGSNVKPKPDFNPLALSDADFEKLDLSKFQL